MMAILACLNLVVLRSALIWSVNVSLDSLIADVLISLVVNFDVGDSGCYGFIILGCHFGRDSCCGFIIIDCHFGR